MWQEVHGGPDEDLFIEYFNSHPEMKLIIAPHVIDENHLVEIIGKLKRPSVRYTRADEKECPEGGLLDNRLFRFALFDLSLWGNCLYRWWFWSRDSQYA